MPLPKNVLPKLEDVESKQKDITDSYEYEDEFLEDLSDEDFGNSDDDIVDYGNMIEDDEYSKMLKEQESEEQISDYTEEKTDTYTYNKPKATKDIFDNKLNKKNNKLKGSLKPNPLDILKKYKTPVIILSSILVAVLILFVVISFLRKDKPTSNETSLESKSPTVEDAIEIGESNTTEDKNYYIEEGKLVVRPMSDSKKFEYIEAAVLTEDGITRCVSFDIKLNEKHEPTILSDCDIDLSGRTIENIIVYEKD